MGLIVFCQESNISASTQKAMDGGTFNAQERRMVMGISIRTLIVVLLTVMSFAAAQKLHAGDEETFSGTVDYVDPDNSEIRIIREDHETSESLTIIGFPFRNLEAQLEEELGEPVSIVEDDCVTITYYEKCDGVNKWLSLTMYCEACTGCSFENDELHCDADPEANSCFEDDQIMTREPQQNRSPKR